jgi:hypothetical protein
MIAFDYTRRNRDGFADSSDSLYILILSRTFEGRPSDHRLVLVRPKVSPKPADRWYEREVTMITSPVHSAPAAQNEAAAKASLRQNPAPQPASVPGDKVTLSPEAQAHAQRAVSSGKDPDGDKK